jgi:hypothetical protein
MEAADPTVGDELRILTIRKPAVVADSLPVRNSGPVPAIAGRSQSLNSMRVACSCVPSALSVPFASTFLPTARSATLPSRNSTLPE